jgi:molybdate transport system ATP-binding protein
LSDARPRSRAPGRQRDRYVGVELRDVRLTLGRRAILRGVDWRIRPAERWILTGENGAGKTLLLKLLAGDVWPTADAGRRRYRLRGRHFDQPYEIHQEIAYVGAERQDRFEHYEWNHPIEQVIGAGLYRSEILLDPLTDVDRRRIERLLKRLQLQGLAGRRFLTLSYGERRLILLARALAAAPRLLLLDEVLNGLDTAYRARVLKLLAQLSRTSLPWVMATHREEDIPAFATHWCRLRAGRLETQRVPRRGTSAIVHLVRAPVRRQQASVRGARSARPVLLVRLQRACVWREGSPALRNVSLALHAGECWVIHGGNGSGKSTLIQTLYGDLGVAVGGTLWRAGVQPGVPIAYFKRRVGLVAPELQAAHPRYLRVDEVVASGLASSIGYDSPRPAKPQRLRRALARVGAGALLHRTVRSLSYGQLRRVLFARALVHEPDILLLDEPYAGLDAAQRAALRRLVERAVATGVTVVLATHHADEWPTGVTHELELVGGRVRYSGAVRRLKAAA